MKATINANGNAITVISEGNENDYISLTDIARYKSDDPTATIQNWMRNKDTIEFLGLWEQLNNPDFKPVEFEGFKKDAGAKTLAMTGEKESKLSEICDVTIQAPQTETYKIQEYHLPVYHYLCQETERYFWEY